MGIVINYSGTMNDMAQIDGLIADVREFCEKAGWPFDEVADPISGVALMTPEDFMGGRSRKKTNRNNWPEEDVFRKGGMTIFFDSKNPILLEETLRGIMAHPPGTDSLMLTFDGKGRLCNYSPLPQDCVRGRLRDLTHYFCFPLFCKTTGETEQHMAICLLLRMLRDRYIKDLKVDDETGFFKSGNVEKMLKDHAVMAGFVGAMRGNPAFIKGLLKLTGVEDAEVVEVLPSKISVTRPKKAAKKSIIQ